MEKPSKEVVVVSLDNYSWDVLMKNKFYAFPKGSRKVGKYFAFYKDGKISHYAEVEKAEEGEKKDVGLKYWLNCFPDADPPYMIVNFNKIRKLRPCIKKDEIGRGKGSIQGRVYTTLNKLLNSKRISEIF